MCAARWKVTKNGSPTDAQGNPIKSLDAYCKGFVQKLSPEGQRELVDEWQQATHPIDAEGERVISAAVGEVSEEEKRKRYEAQMNQTLYGRLMMGTAFRQDSSEARELAKKEVSAQLEKLKSKGIE